MTRKSITIATRKSPLALWQANWVKACLENSHPHLAVHLLGMTTTADNMPFLPLNKVGGKGLFVKELEEALLSKKADIAVHSMKDMPMDLPVGLRLGAICTREDPWDVFISNAYGAFAHLPEGAIVGTSSLRRQSQLLALRPDITTHYLRGNINTRLAALDKGEFAAIVLAQAGLNRLCLEDRIREVFTADHILPAAGQGALGIECREDDSEIAAIIATLNDAATSLCVKAERAMCKELGGGCSVPVAAYAVIEDEEIFLRGLVSEPNGSLVLKAEAVNTLSHPEILGIAVAKDLLNQGAGDILASLAGR
ncbi:MAG: hydroxymethylbilane synthase [Gammaproteobacteria bacterium]|nr:hydroxymethylbilane synthase [Gammaproteobacteria bacterium]